MPRGDFCYRKKLAIFDAICIKMLNVFGAIWNNIARLILLCKCTVIFSHQYFLCWRIKDMIDSISSMCYYSIALEWEDYWIRFRYTQSNNDINNFISDLHHIDVFERLGWGRCTLSAALYRHNTAKDWCILIKPLKPSYKAAFDEFCKDKSPTMILCKISTVAKLFLVTFCDNNNHNLNGLTNHVPV